jgi:hypothetical protein
MVLVVFGVGVGVGVVFGVVFGAVFGAVFGVPEMIGREIVGRLATV